VRDGVDRSEKAAFYLEGGFMTVLEGLSNSRGPCARVLSVSGLLAIIWRFLGSEGFILRGERPAPLLPRPCLFNNGVKPAHTRGVGWCTNPGVYPAMYMGCMYHLRA